MLSTKATCRGARCLSTSKGWAIATWRVTLALPGVSPFRKVVPKQARCMHRQWVSPSLSTFSKRTPLQTWMPSSLIAQMAVALSPAAVALPYNVRVSTAAEFSLPGLQGLPQQACPRNMQFQCSRCRCKANNRRLLGARALHRDPRGRNRRAGHARARGGPSRAARTHS